MAEGFAKLDRIVTIQAIYQTHGTVSINTGRGDGIRDSLVIREGGPESKPIISGSSLKGVVRSTIEAILARATGNGGVCAPGVCCEKDRNRNWILPPGRKAPCESGRETPCPVCQMFGNTRMRGRVTFHDAKPEGEVATLSRTHVAIDRNTGTAARSGALMTLETVPGDKVSFTGKITLANPDPWMVGAVLVTLRLLPELGVGAKKTSGYGDLSVEIRSLEFALRPREETEKEEVYQQQCEAAWREMAKIAESLGREE